ESPEAPPSDAMVNDATTMTDDGSRPSQLVGRSIAGKFVVESLIATGGAGTVYRARQLALDRTVALKVLRQDVARDAHFVERFKREARAASRLDHPNSVRVFDFGYVDDALLYLAMEYVEGRTLQHMIDEEWPLGEARIVDIMSQVLSAIAVAHDMEVIHRDLKPDNIMIIPTTSDDGEATELAKVCDFGIATLGAIQRDRAAGPATGPWVTLDGSLVGTPGYMSPEQARGEHADRRSDIYSAGVILYHMLVGRPPFEGESAYFVAMKHITDPPLPPSEITAVDPGLEAVCLRALAKAPGDRFDNAREMRAALRAALARATPAGVATDARGTPGPIVVTAVQPVKVQAPNTVELLEGAGIGARARRCRALTTAVGVAAVAVVVGAFAARSMFRAERADARTIAPTTPVVAQTPAAPPAHTDVAPKPPVETAPAPGAVADEPAPRPREVSRSRRERDATLTPTLSRKREREKESVAVKLTAQPIAAPVPVAVAPALPAPVAAPAPPAPPPAPRIDVERATATIAGITSTSAIPGSNIRAALARVPLARCYRDALRAGGLASGTATLRLRIDSGGYVTGAALQGAAITPALKTCIEKAATTIRIKDVDTGEATADVTLSLNAAP
ncbi:MAG TPA: protein kinase, partial [Polyangia bacterium]|nr:protein kinase [Polyangia bacterium]